MGATFKPWPRRGRALHCITSENCFSCSQQNLLTMNRLHHSTTNPSLKYHGKGIDIATAAYVSELGHLANPVSRCLVNADALTASYIYLLCQGTFVTFLDFNVHLILYSSVGPTSAASRVFCRFERYHHARNSQSLRFDTFWT